MATRLDANILVVLGADFAQLEGGSHLTVKLILLLCHLYVVLGSRLHCPRQVGVHVPPVREQVAVDVETQL